MIAATTITEIELFISQISLPLRSLESGFLMIAEIFFSVMAAITAIIWKLGLSYASLTKYILITIILSKQEGWIMLFTFSCFNCQNEKGLLKFVSERIKLVYGLTMLGTTCKKNKLPFTHLKLQFIGHTLSN